MFAEIFFRNTRASGVIPQISLIMGPAAGGAVYSPAITDFTLMVEGTSHMFITGPDVIKTVTGEDVTFEELGGAAAHMTKSGVAHYQATDEEDCIEFARLLLSYLPSNNLDEPPAVPAVPDYALSAADEELDVLIPDSPNQPYDMHRVIETVLDEDTFCEVHEGFAREHRGRLRPRRRRPRGSGRQPAAAPGRLPRHRRLGESRPVRPHLRRVQRPRADVRRRARVPARRRPGARAGIIRRGAKLLYAYAEATVPKVTVITRKAYGGAYDVMGSKHLGGDVNLAWPTAQIAVMGAAGAVSILYRRELAAADDPDQLRAQQHHPVRGHPRQPLHRRRARLPRRRHPPRRNPHPHHQGPHLTAHQTRNPPTQKTRQHPPISVGRQPCLQ